MQPDLQMEHDSASELRNAAMIARNGDSSAFEAIMRRHNQRLYRIARTILRDDAEAEDIVQEAYIKAFTHGDSFKGQGNLGAWLAKVTANFAISRLRQLKRRRTETLDTGTLEKIQSEGIFSPGHMTPERRAANFDPIGILVDPGTVIRWIVRQNVHTATAYHPANGTPLRIPQNAVPWDSDYLINPGDTFETTLTAKGTYDYFCAPHEAAGMVGRIIVGEPTGLSIGGFEGQEIPVAAINGFPSTKAIMEKRVIRK